MKAPLLLALSVAAALVSVAGLSYWVAGAPVSDRRPEPPATSRLKTGKGDDIWRITLPDIKGTSQKLDQWRGKILVVNYWATWCPPCREEMPAFSRLNTKYAPKDVQFVGISIDTLNKVVEFQKATPVSYPLLIGSMETVQTSISAGNSAQALPFTAVFDRAGALHSVKLGRFSEAELEQQLQGLVGQN